MKKCASCTKDLPDAALHCVFCGTKQPVTTPPPQPAKTVMGYAAADMIEQLKKQQAVNAARPKPPTVDPAGTPPPEPIDATVAPHRAPAPASPPAPVAAAAPAPAAPSYAATVAPSAPIPPLASPPPQATPAPLVGPQAAAPFAATTPPPAAPGSAGLVATPSSATTVFITDSAPPPPPRDGGTGSVPVVLEAPPKGVAVAVPVEAVAVPARGAPVPILPPPVVAMRPSATALPRDPFAGSLRGVMIVFGLLLLGAFATPLTTSDLRFNWDTINTPGTSLATLLPLLLMAGIGFLSLVIGAIPMGSGVRGAIATLLGLGGVLTTRIYNLIEGGDVTVGLIAAIIALILLIPSLLARAQYRDSVLPRILVTLGVLGVLAPFLIPTQDVIPIAASVNALTAGGTLLDMLPAIFMLVTVALCVLALLAWIPSPSSGGAGLWAWLFILRGMWTAMTTVIVTGGIGARVKGAPFETLAGWVPNVAYAAILGYGLATVIGKQLD